MMKFAKDDLFFLILVVYFTFIFIVFSLYVMNSCYMLRRVKISTYLKLFLFRWKLIRKSINNNNWYRYNL